MSDEKRVERNGRWEELPTWDASALAPGVRKRIVFGPGGVNEGGDVVVRHFVLPPGEKIPPHRHDWDHLVLSVAGHWRLVVDGEVQDLSAGRYGHVPPGAEHVFENPVEEDFAFFCIVPVGGDPHAKKIAMRAERAARKAARPGATEEVGEEEA